MMTYEPELIPSDRLTWPAIWPLPFESFWSIVNKVLALNHLTCGELIALIKKDHTYKRFGTIESSDTDWVDFRRFANLLGIREERLKEGCRDQLGIDAEGLPRGIRTCPRCWNEACYHSVFFDLGVLSECPFHKCKLSTPCKRCTSQLRFTVRSEKRTGVFKRYCVACKSTTPNLTSLINMSNLNCEFADTLQREGVEFLRWWTKFGEDFPARDIVAADLLYDWQDKGSQPLSWKRYIAITHDSYYLPSWLQQAPCTPAQYFCWSEFLSDRTSFRFRDEVRQHMWSSDIGRSYRSLKKYIYARFVRPHARCYRELMKLSWKQCQILRGEKLCITAVAFAAWRMAIEGVIRLEDLHGVRKRRFELKLSEIYEYEGMSLEGSLRLSYFTFLSIWSELQQRRNIRIMFDTFSPSKPIVYYRCRPSFDDRDITGSGKKIDIHLLAPNPSELAMRGYCSCHGFSATDVESIPEGFDIFTFTEMAQCLFQIRFLPSFYRSRMFDYLLL